MQSRKRFLLRPDPLPQIPINLNPERAPTTYLDLARPKDEVGNAPSVVLDGSAYPPAPSQDGFVLAERPPKKKPSISPSNAPREHNSLERLRFEYARCELRMKQLPGYCEAMEVLDQERQRLEAQIRELENA